MWRPYLFMSVLVNTMASQTSLTYRMAFRGKGEVKGRMTLFLPLSNLIIVLLFHPSFFPSLSFRSGPKEGDR
ncbi:hypothetical protein BKA57DRAFT_454530 [Linnemannia elongata]|nr:hypothetical protein BKA57DRAFT_454530 [Linnemannia elongata]